MAVTSVPTVLPEKTRGQLVVYMVLLYIFAWLSLKIALPALPELARVFNTRPIFLKLSVTTFLFCYSLSQPLWGGLAEWYGRRPIILLALAITTCGAVVSMLSFHISQYIIGRSLEGLGVAAIAANGRAVLIDILDIKQFARTMVIVSTCSTALMPAVGPIVGGHLLVWFSWRAIFALLVILAVIFLVWGIGRFRETKPSQRLTSLGKTFASYLYIIKQRVFWGYALPYATLAAAMIGYYTAMPFWFVTQYGIAADHYAYLALFSVGGYIIGLNIARRLLKHLKVNSILIMGISLALIDAVATLVFAYFIPGSVIALVTIMTVLTFSLGFVSPTANAGVMAGLKKVASPTSAMLSTSVFLLATILSPIAMNLMVKTLWQVGIFLCVVVAIGFSGFSVCILRNKTLTHTS